MSRTSLSSNRIRAASILVFIAMTAAGCAVQQPAREEPGVVPPPSLDLAAGGDSSEVAVLAGGCFWGVQGVYQHVKGVTAAVSGYAGGDASTANYEGSSRGGSGHAESVQISFDPRQVSYGRLLQLYFSVVHDPTELNRQGPDVGTQYRSAIFPQNAEQEKVARTYVAQLEKARVFDEPIVTTIELARPFYRAEDYHQDYLERHPSQPYIFINDLPKIAALQRQFPDLYRPTPVLVAAR
jgi:peptide-methionine (S)-S-oxide reductase